MSTLDLVIECVTAALVALTAMFNARGRDKLNKANDWNAAVAAETLHKTTQVETQVTPGNGPGTMVHLIETAAATIAGQDATNPPPSGARATGSKA